MPMHSYRDADGEPVAVCGEGRFTSSVSQAIAKRGFMPLLSVRGRDSIELACIRSMAAERERSLAGWLGRRSPSKKRRKRRAGECQRRHDVGLGAALAAQCEGPSRPSPAVRRDSEMPDSAMTTCPPTNRLADEDTPSDSDSELR